MWPSSLKAIAVFFRAWLAIAVLTVAASGGNALATGALSFEGGGYILDFTMGQQERPVLASLSFSAPGSSLNSILRPPDLVVVAFDAKAKRLLVRYSNPEDNTLPRDFEFSVHGNEGTLKLPNRSITGRFNWEM